MHNTIFSDYVKKKFGILDIHGHMVENFESVKQYSDEIRHGEFGFSFTLGYLRWKKRMQRDVFMVISQCSRAW